MEAVLSDARWRALDVSEARDVGAVRALTTSAPRATHETAINYAETRPEPGPPALISARSRVTDLITLTKVRVNVLVVATTAGGFYMASTGPMDLGALAVTCLGTALVASGAAAFNQVTERDDRPAHGAHPQAAGRRGPDARRPRGTRSRRRCRSPDC